MTQKRRANKNTISAIDSKSSNEVNNNDLYPDEEEASVEIDVFDDFNVSEDVQKNLDATQLYLGEIGRFHLDIIGWHLSFFGHLQKH